PFVVTSDSVVFERSLKQRMQEVEPGLVVGKPGAHFFHAAERPDSNAPIRISAPGTAPVLEPQQLFRRLFYENFDGILIAEPVAAGDGIVGMVIECIPRFDYPRMQPKPAFPFWTSKQTALYIELSSVGAVLAHGPIKETQGRLASIVRKLRLA